MIIIFTQSKMNVSSPNMLNTFKGIYARLGLFVNNFFFNQNFIINSQYKILLNQDNHF